MGLHFHVELIEFLHAGFARAVGSDGGTEFLKVRAYSIECNSGSAVGTFDSRHVYILEAIRREAEEFRLSDETRRQDR
jgi:hypothetical protein